MMQSVRGMRDVVERTDDWFRLSCGHKIVPTSDQRTRGRPSAICKECRAAKLTPKQVAARTIQRRREMGRCWNCETPALEGHTFCEKHLVYLRERSRKAGQSESVAK